MTGLQVPWQCVGRCTPQQQSDVAVVGLRKVQCALAIVTTPEAAAFTDAACRQAPGGLSGSHCEPVLERECTHFIAVGWA